MSRDIFVRDIPEDVQAVAGIPDGWMPVAASMGRGVVTPPRSVAHGPGVSEELIAEALSPYDGLLIATKGGYERTGPSGESATGELIGWTPNGRPDHLRSACEASLRRLRLDRIDLYQRLAARSVSRHTAHPRQRNTRAPRRQSRSSRAPTRTRRDTRDHRGGIEGNGAGYPSHLSIST
jgi:Aldo/keto reductase family